MIATSKAGIIMGGDISDLTSEYYGITKALIKKAPEAVLAVTAKTAPEMNDLMDNGKINDLVLNLLIKELDNISIKEVE